MEAGIVDNYLMSNIKYFESARVNLIRQDLLNMTPEQFRAVQFIDYRDPIIMLIVSIVVGSFGIDRFLLGQIGWGVLKLITLGGLGIWTLVDWFLIMGMTKEYNLNQFMQTARYSRPTPTHIIK